MQSKLEKNGIEERKNETLKNDFNVTDQYSDKHKNAIANGDKYGKGTNHGGHTHFLPDQSKSSSTIDYSNFDTENGGNVYDIEGRNDIGGRNKMISFTLYNKDYQYGAHLIDTEENQRNGQYKN